MALNAYLRLTGKAQGEIRGGVTQKGREGSIMVISLWHEIVSPRDPVSHRPTGKRHHKPLIITKETDRATPLLYSVLAHNEIVTSWKLQLWRASPTGAEQQHYTIELFNANVSSIQFRMPNNKHPHLMRFSEYEEVAFTYQKIIWTWTDGGITADDDWESPRA
jgi:type VI secretion system secreted protein Hcp